MIHPRRIFWTDSSRNSPAIFSCPPGSPDCTKIIASNLNKLVLHRLRRRRNMTRKKTKTWTDHAKLTNQPPSKEVPPHKYFRIPLFRPRAIAVDPLGRRLFWSDTFRGTFTIKSRSRIIHCCIFSVSCLDAYKPRCWLSNNQSTPISFPAGWTGLIPKWLSKAEAKNRSVSTSTRSMSTGLTGPRTACGG